MTEKTEITAEEAIEEINRLSSILSFEKDEKYELIEDEPEPDKPRGIMKVTQRIHDMLYHELIEGRAYSYYNAHMDGDDMIVDNCKVELI